MFNQIVYICKLMKNAWKISGTAFFEVIWVDGNQGGGLLALISNYQMCIHNFDWFVQMCSVIKRLQ